MLGPVKTPYGTSVTPLTSQFQTEAASAFYDIPAYRQDADSASSLLGQTQASRACASAFISALATCVMTFSVQGEFVEGISRIYPMGMVAKQCECSYHHLAVHSEKVKMVNLMYI